MTGDRTTLDPVQEGTRAYLDGVVSHLSRPERRQFYRWLAIEVKQCTDDNDDLMAERESD